MSAFEFLFGFYGLIMGLAVANAAGGFGAMWRDRHALKIGWCAPLLSAQILFSAVSIWLGIWSSAETIEINQTMLLGALAVSVPYVFISVVMFPRDAGTVLSLDDHYLAHARSLIGALIISRGTFLVWLISVGYVSGLSDWLLFVLPQWIVLIPLFFWRNLTAHRIGLAILAVHMFSRVVVWTPS